MRQAKRWLTVLLLSCGGRLDGVSVGGETHFLVTCGEDCGAGLSCIEGVCTRSCEPGFSSCSELASDAQCVGAFDSGRPFAGTCDVRCTADAECSALGRGFTCRAGACRAEPEARLTELSPLGSARQPLVRAVETDTCLTGLRWVGADRGSGEMHPGSDCVSCHDDDAELPFLFAGTVYALDPVVPLFSVDGQPLDGCFGLEGITVEITDADGEVRSTRTNRAGNFYFEGRQADGVWPYVAELQYRRGRRDQGPPMFTSPSYGGCARCHYLPSAAPSEELIRSFRGIYEELPTRITPAGTVIFAPNFFSQ